MIIIPIGIDCGIAEILRKYKIRTMAFPFDWIVSYFGITKILKNDFKDYIPDIKDSVGIYDGCHNIFNHFYGTKFIHDKFPEKEEYDKYERRINRFKDILNNSTDEIIFFKKGHAYHNHGEYNFKDDIDDVVELNNYLKDNYINLKYKIVLVLLCYNCYCNNNLEKIKDDKIIVYKHLITDIRSIKMHNNIITGMEFEKIFLQIKKDMFF